MMSQQIGDLISRQAVLDLIEHKYGMLSHPDVISKFIKLEEEINDIPPVPHETVTEFADRCRECGAKYGKLLKQESRWIPVSERLPNLDDYTGSEVWQKEVLITGYLSFDDTKELFVSEAFAKDVICNCVPDTVVIAWMPLPEPYKVESEDKYDSRGIN